MYGKIFEDIFDSSLATGGDFVTTYVFMSMIVLADEHGFVHLSRDALFERLRFPNDFVCGEAFRNALRLLESPDEESNLPYENGRRIIPLSEIEEIEGNRGWWIVNYLHYRNKGNRTERQEGRREYMREYMRARREKEKKIKDIGSCKHTVNNCKQKNSYTDTDTDTEKKKNGRSATLFPSFWEVYPKKRKKQEARKVWKSKSLDRMAETIISDVEARKTKDDRWVAGFVPDPTTYLRGARWEDELGEGGDSRTPEQREADLAKMREELGDA